MKRLGAIVALVLVAMLCFPWQVVAVFYMDVTLISSDNTALPGPPTLTATLVSNTQVQLDWIAGAGATGTVIRAKHGVAPTSILDGYAVYTGAALTCNDWISNIELSDNSLCYSAWAYNGVGYSLTYDTACVEGGTMAAAIGMVGVAIFFLVGVALNWAAWWREKWWVCPIAMFFWAGLAYYCYTESAGSFDFYKFLTWVCTGFALISIAEIFVLRKKAEEEPEETMQERIKKRMDANLANTFNKERPTVKRPDRDGGLGL